MKRTWLFVLLSAAVATSCLRLMSEPDKCSSDTDCVDGSLCRSGVCHDPLWCQRSADCHQGFECLIATQTCTAHDQMPDAGHPCWRASDCGAGSTCRAGQCECVPSAEVCNGRDDDCDGLIDEDFQIGTACGGNSRCGAGVWECAGLSAGRCSTARGGSAFDGGQPEACNGLDDDCDGQVDEELGSVSCGVGACVRTVQSCQNGAAAPCTPGMPTTDVCDGIDNDCNGKVDDDASQWVDVQEEAMVDRCSGLTWQRQWVSLQTHAQAAAYCDGLSLAGFSDWRLPTLLDYEHLLGDCKTCSWPADSSCIAQCTRCQDGPHCHQVFPDDIGASSNWIAGDQGWGAVWGAYRVFLSSGRITGVDTRYYPGNSTTESPRCVRP